MPARGATPLHLPALLPGGFVPTAIIYQGPWSKVLRVRTGECPSDSRGCYVMKLPTGEGEKAVVAENMLRREASILTSVTQPNLVTLLNGNLRATPYLVTPFLEGATLNDVFDAGLRCPVAHALWITRQVAQALTALHDAGWRHGDLKPENILVSPTGHATLLDLGLAHRLDAGSVSPSANVIAGSLWYMPPECLQPNNRIDQHADIYSLGAILFQMIAGRPPFVGPNSASLIEAQLHAAPPELPLKGCAVASDVRSLVAQMLAKNPLRRPASANSLANRLMRLEIATLRDVAA